MSGRFTPEYAASLRTHVAELLAAPYKANQMTYDLRRLRLKGLIRRVPGKNRYVLTPFGRRVVIFFSKLDSRIFTAAIVASVFHAETCLICEGFAA